MKSLTINTSKIVSCVASLAGLAAVNLLASHQVYAQDSVDLIAKCINNYQDYPSSIRGSGRSEDNAERACQNATPSEASQSILNCINNYLYYPSGSIRSNRTEDNAERACQNATTPEASQSVIKCINNYLYYPSGPIRSGRTEDNAVKVCRD